MLDFDRDLKYSSFLQSYLIHPLQRIRKGDVFSDLESIFTAVAENQNFLFNIFINVLIYIIYIKKSDLSRYAVDTTL